MCTKNEVQETTVKSRKIAQQFDDSEDEDIRDVLLYEFNNKRDVVEYLQYLKGLLMPIMEAYTITAFCLDKLVGRSLLESEFVNVILDEIKIGLRKETLKYGKIHHKTLLIIN